VSGALIEATGLAKTFTLHTRGGVRIPVFRGVDLRVGPGECVVLSGPSGAGKSTLLRSLYGNYKPSAGRVRVRHAGGWIDLTAARAHEILALRRDTLGYVSQFLRAIPRVSALDVVAEPLRAQGHAADPARAAAAAMLRRLALPEALWEVPPATFSGGEQQRVNIARTFAPRFPVLLLDEPTASLDAANRQVVVELIEEAKRAGSAVIGIFHDEEVRDAVGTTLLDVTRFRLAA
jgi:alpha-D-ribose 1-methylphosphonate 5-triphosphate synthase subunit PhnL